MEKQQRYGEIPSFGHSSTLFTHWK